MQGSEIQALEGSESPGLGDWHNTRQEQVADTATEVDVNIAHDTHVVFKKLQERGKIPAQTGPSGNYKRP